MTKEIISNKMVEAVNNANEAMENLFAKHFADTPYEITSFGYNEFQIGFVNDTWYDGTPKYENLRFYCGNFRMDDNISYDDYKFTINPASYGDFDPTKNDSYINTYFCLISKILTDQEFTVAAKKIMYQLYITYLPLWKQLCDINNKERKAQQDAENKKRQEAEDKDQAEKKLLIDANGSSETYVIIKKGDGGKFIYRKAPVKVMTKPLDYTAARIQLAELNRGYLPVGVKYVIVETSKVKWVA